MIVLSLLMIPFSSSSVFDNFMSILIRDVLMILGLGVAFVFMYCKKNGNDSWAEIGINNHKTVLSLVLNLVFAAGLLFVFMKDGKPQNLFCVENLYGTVYIIAAGVFEMLFIYGYLRSEFAQAFGIGESRECRVGVARGSSVEESCDSDFSEVSEKQTYDKLSAIFKDKVAWESSVDFVAQFLKSSQKLQAKALWILGEMGLVFPNKVSPYIPAIADFMKSSDSLLRSRSITALGRIGRAEYSLVAPSWKDILFSKDDKSPEVRLSFIWASENIATNKVDVE